MRAFQDLREFPGVLEQEKQLLRIDDPVTLEPGLGTVGCALTRSGKPAWPLYTIVQPIAPPNVPGKTTAHGNLLCRNFDLRYLRPMSGLWFSGSPAFTDLSHPSISRMHQRPPLWPGRAAASRMGVACEWTRCQRPSRRTNTRVNKRWSSIAPSGSFPLAVDR